MESEQSPVEERASTTLVDVGDSELIILKTLPKTSNTGRDGFDTHGKHTGA